MPNKPVRVRKIKAWAIISEQGIMSKYTPKLPIYTSERSAMENVSKPLLDSLAKVVPCTISYSLPLTKKRK